MGRKSVTRLSIVLKGVIETSDVTLSDSIDNQGVETDYKEGILKIVLPKLVRSQRKLININVS